MRFTVFSQSLRRFARIAGMICILGVVTATLGACGIKPSEVDPPQGEKLDTFPRTYPAPQYDPAPERLIR